MSSDATAVSSQKQRADKSKRLSPAIIAWLILGIVFLLIVLTIVLWSLGYTVGREFDASTWTFRRFTFVRNPLTGNQFSGINRNNDFAVAPKILTYISGGPLAPGTRWDLVEIYKGPSRYGGQAHILLDYLSALNQKNNYYWEDWTNEHPKAAPIFWSAVRDCVHLPRYDRLPELFETARTITDPVELKSQLNNRMLDIAQDEIELQTAAGNLEAKERAEKLLKAYQPES